MENFTHHIPTTVYFGKDEITHLPESVKKLGSKVLLAYGGGSIKKMGLYDTVVTLLKENGIAWVEISGIAPNPLVDSVREGVQLCREHNVNVILAVGGGSTIDCAKAIAACVAYNGDPWDVVLDWSKITSVLPVISVLTLSATGSEMDSGAVISNSATSDKLAVMHPEMTPKYSILDPTYTYSVPKYQTAAGTADIMSHILEVYFQSATGTFMVDRIAEALLKTCIHYAPIVMKNPENYDARANLMWAGSWAINGLLSGGKVEEWTIHPMEHELSAFYNITHGVGLAILTPHWMNYVLNDTTIDKFVEYGKNVWNIDPSLPKKEIAEKAIKATKDFFQSLEIASTLSEVGIDEEKLDLMAEKSAVWLKNAYVPLTKKDVLAIFKAAL